MENKSKENVKEQMIQEAIKLFVRKSFKGTRIQDITDAVGVTKGAFYWHFKSKAELLDTIIDEYERVNVDHVFFQLEQTPGNFIQKYKLFHKITTEFAYENRELCIGFMALAAELTGSETTHEQKIISVYTKLRLFLKGLIEQGKRDGCVRSDVDSEMIAHFINAINNGMLLEWYMFQDDINGPMLAKTYRQIAVQGISA
ncbi:transcriptional regulator, TetR family [delta proteobacterium NaphS2]|nr:transcriptional regulator, TetR family [delta proteobacterium NaphS2]